VNSRAKGKRGERAWAAELREQGYAARRGVQYAGGVDSPDVVCDALPQCHFEVKLTEALRLHDAVAQALADRLDGQLAIVAHRRSRDRWLVTMTAEDFFRLVRSADLEDIR
jgi:Holliday junction resolvase